MITSFYPSFQRDHDRQTQSVGPKTEASRLRATPLWQRVAHPVVWVNFSEFIYNSRLPYYYILYKSPANTFYGRAQFKPLPKKMFKYSFSKLFIPWKGYFLNIQNTYSVVLQVFYKSRNPELFEWLIIFWVSTVFYYKYYKTPSKYLYKKYLTPNIRTYPYTPIYRLFILDCYYGGSSYQYGRDRSGTGRGFRNRS